MPEYVRSTIAIFIIVVGLTFITALAIFQTPADAEEYASLVSGLMGAVVGYYFGVKGGETAAKAVSDTASIQITQANSLVQQATGEIQNELPKLKASSDREQTLVKVLEEVKRQEPELYERILKYAERI